MHIVYSKHNKQQYTTSGIPSEYETTINKTTELEMKTNKAYGQIQHNQTNRPPTTIESSMYETVVPWYWLYCYSFVIQIVCHLDKKIIHLVCYILFSVSLNKFCYYKDSLNLFTTDTNIIYNKQQ